MTSLAASLPRELILHILQLALELPPTSFAANLRRTRYPFLRAAALVCRSFLPVAHALLWEKVDLRNPQQATVFRRVGGGQKRTRELNYNAYRESSRAQRKVLELFPELETLELRSVSIEPLALISSPAMAGV